MLTSHPAASPGEPVVEFQSVAKRYGAVTAVDAISFRVARGEFFSLLGPSGCGKTTTLRLLAGFETPDAGVVRLLGESVNDRRPYERPLAMVFQNYALFPHLSVERNVAFGLEQRHVPPAQMADRVARALTLVRLDPGVFARRLPSQLSGGQRQRVALARALVLEPPLLLLDEPLGALDLKLRKAMQLELKALNRALGMTFVYVTHDQEEALTMSDRIAVMHEGRIAQVGTPADIYESPRTGFVAEFIGEANFFEGRVRGKDGKDGKDGRDGKDGIVVEVVDGLGRAFDVPLGAAQVSLGATDAVVRIAVRPEWMDLALPDAVPPGENAIAATVREVVYLGETLHVLLDAGLSEPVRVAVRNEGQLQNPIAWRPGDRAVVAWKPEDCQVLDG